MIILEDSRQQARKHDNKHRYFAEAGIEVRRTKLYVGDYTLPTDQSICVDTKKDIQELVTDVVQDHERFRAECVRAQEAGIQLVILVEDIGGYADRQHKVFNRPVKNLDDLFQWANPRLFIRKDGKQKYPKATRGSQLAKICMTMQKKYGVRFEFCLPVESGRRVVEILTEE